MAFMNKLESNDKLGINSDDVTLVDQSQPWNGYLLYKTHQISGCDDYNENQAKGQRFQICDTAQQHTPVRFVTWFGAAMYARDRGRELPTDAEWVRAAAHGNY